MSNLPVPSDYTVLREEILQIISAGKDRARSAVEREKVRTYWEIGRVLHGHLRHWYRRLMQRNLAWRRRSVSLDTVEFIHAV